MRTSTLTRTRTRHGAGPWGSARTRKPRNDERGSKAAARRRRRGRRPCARVRRCVAVVAESAPRPCVVAGAAVVAESAPRPCVVAGAGPLPIPII